jgi:hypothetical protein
MGASIPVQGTCAVMGVLERQGMIISLAVMFVAILLSSLPVRAAEPAHRHESGASCGAAQPELSSRVRFQGVQLETADIGQHEWFFEAFLQAQVVFKVDHPQVDHLRGYCYRDVMVVIRQDLKTPKPTGWMQVNFSVPDVEAVKTELEQALSAAHAGKAPAGSARLRLKADVPRSNCRVARLEVYGPEGFLIGFDQVKPETCQAQQPRKEGSP